MRGSHGFESNTGIIKVEHEARGATATQYHNIARSCPLDSHGSTLERGASMKDGVTEGTSPSVLVEPTNPENSALQLEEGETHG